MELYNSIAAIAITFALLGGCLWLLRRFSTTTLGDRTFRWNRSPQERHLRSIEKLVLTPDCTLHLVNVEGHTILLAVGGKAVVPVQFADGREKALRAVGGAA